MIIKYRSSTLGVGFNYLSPILLLFLSWVLFNITLEVKYSNSSTIIFLILVWFLILIFFILTIKYCMKTRYIKVTDMNILIKTIKGDRVLEYKDIISITENNTRGVTLSLKYKDNKIGKNCTIFTVPGSYLHWGYGIDPKNKSDMFKYIQERITINNQSIT